MKEIDRCNECHTAKWLGDKCRACMLHACGPLCDIHPKPPKKQRVGWIIENPTYNKGRCEVCGTWSGLSLLCNPCLKKNPVYTPGGTILFGSERDEYMKAAF